MPTVSQSHRVLRNSAITYVVLFHRYEISLAFGGLYRSVLSRFRRGSVQAEEDDLSEDIHYRLMRQNYRDVPEWVYLIVLLVSATIGMIGVGIYPSNTSPVVVIYGILMPILCMIPCGIIQAVTGLAVPTNVIAEFIGGALNEGNADALMYFKTYGYISCYQALLFSNDLKLAHYSKLPPWHTFAVQMWATFIYCIVSSSIFNFALGLPGVCTSDGTFNFTCPGQHVYFTASVFWGTLSPKRLYGPGKRYNTMLIGFPVGVVLVLGLLSSRMGLSWLTRYQFTGPCVNVGRDGSCFVRFTPCSCARVPSGSPHLITCLGTSLQSTSPCSPSSSSG